MVLDIQTVHHILKKYSSQNVNKPFVYITDLTSTLNLSLLMIPLINPLYCINSLGRSNFGVFESLHKEKHIYSTRKRVQSATHRIFHRKPAQFFENSTKLCEIYIRSLSDPLEFGIVRVRTSVWANKRKMYHKLGVSRLLRT